MPKKMMVSALVAVAAVALACSSGGNDAENSDSSDGSNAGTVNDKAAKVTRLNQPARDGKFEFVVSGVKCGATKVGPSGFGEKAQGQFCFVSVSVRNIGKEAQLFDGSSQKAHDAKGTEFSNDSGAEMYANEGSPTFLQEINPGNQVKGRLVFDVPKKTKLAKIELHDSPFSGGVTVNLA
jgi:Domain of unknown function (DUF4352)